MNARCPDAEEAATYTDSDAGRLSFSSLLDADFVSVFFPPLRAFGTGVGAIKALGSGEIQNEGHYSDRPHATTDAPYA